MKSRNEWHGLFRLLRPEKPKPTGNPVQWAREAVANLDCQESVDAKAFTGKGNLHELRRLVTALEAVEDRMRELSAASSALDSAYIYLMVHHRRDDAYTFLRWRERVGGNRHLPWGDLDAKLAGHPPAQQRWCAEASALAHQLNAEHLALRKRIKALRLQLSQTPSQVYAKPIPSEG